MTGLNGATMPSVIGLNPYLQDTLNIFWLLLGLFMAGLLEASLWKTPVFERFNHPIQTAWFGPNKRWRGLISLPLTAVVATFTFQMLEHRIPSFPQGWIGFSGFNGFEYGLLTGFICNLAELPNSFLKRRLNIPAGDESNALWFVVDHLDSTLGLLLLWGLYFEFPGHLIVTGVVVSPILFMLATWVRKGLKLKD